MKAKLATLPADNPRLTRLAVMLGLLVLLLAAGAGDVAADATVEPEFYDAL